MEIKYKILARMGIRWTGIYDEHGELIDFHIRQTLIRRFLNWIWGHWNTWRYNDPFGKGMDGAKDDGDLPNYLYQTEFYK